VSHPATSDLLIREGTCHVLWAYDIGQSIDLDRAERFIDQATERETIKHRRRSPQYFEYRPAPLKIVLEAAPIGLGAQATEPGVECLLFDFGAVLVVYAVTIVGPLTALAPLSDALYDCQALRDDSRRRVERLLASIRPAVARPGVSAFVEDYTIYEVRRWDGPATAAALLDRHGPAIAQVLRAEMQPLSDPELQDALACRLSYSRDDLAIIDWNAAMLLARESDDIRAVLEFANVELLEMRHLDDMLDAVVDEFYRALSGRTWRRRIMPASAAGELRRLSRLQMDAAVLFEEVNNALKLLGDQYLARVYRAVSQRLHLGEWDSSILRKLHTIESIHARIADYQSARRMEALEWIIILLIAFEIIMSLFPGLRGG
jgi:hypothetical protein